MHCCVPIVSNKCCSCSLVLANGCYVQVFVRVYTSAAEIKNSAAKQAYVWQSQGCDSWWLQPVGQVIQRGNHNKHLPANGPAVPGLR